MSRLLHAVLVFVVAAALTIGCSRRTKPPPEPPNADPPPADQKPVIK